MKSTKGFTILEMLVIIAIVGILAVIAGPQLLFANKPLPNATNQLSGIFKQTRARAMATTSVSQVIPTSATQLKVQTAQSRVCAASSQLTSAAVTTDTVIRVVSANSFAIGDQVIVGSSNTNSVIATDPSRNTITLGQALGSNQPINANVNLSINWLTEASFSNDDLTLPKGIQMSPTNWIICFDSRGIANQYNSSGNLIGGNLTVKLTDTSGKTSTVQVLQGGATQ